MSKKKKNNNNDNNKVSISNINIDKIKKELLKNDKNNEYQEFCDKYIDENFESYDIENLKKIYDMGNGLLYQYFVTEEKNCDSEIVKKLQYIINGLTYNLIVKQYEKLRLQNEKIDSKLTKTIERAEKLNNNSKKITKEVTDIKKDMRSIITTIISVILAISIIPTAIVGIDKISADYILPFLSSIILFGVIMITFVYSIYQEKLKKSTWIILFLIIIICICFWTVSFITTISRDIDNQNLIINEINIQTEDITPE